jgi:hypothetical protein
MANVECFGARRDPSKFKIRSEDHGSFCCLTVSVGDDSLTVFLPAESTDAARYVAAAAKAAFHPVPDNNPEAVSGSNIIPLVPSPDQR